MAVCLVLSKAGGCTLGVEWLSFHVEWQRCDRSYAPFTALSEAAGLVGTDIASRFLRSCAFVTLDITCFFLPTCIFQSPNRLRYIHTCMHMLLPMLQRSTAVLCLGMFIGLIYPGAQAWWSHQTFLSVCFMAIAIVLTFHMILLKQRRDSGCYTFPKIKLHKFHVFLSIGRRVRREARFPEILNNLVQGIFFFNLNVCKVNM